MEPSMHNIDSTVFLVFKTCVEAIRQGVFIKKESKRDKEYHFQDWFENRLKETELNYTRGKRNKYPDFNVSTREGFELKGLAYPGREINFDSNSQIPTGSHNGRDIYYVFGRYPKEPDGDEYPVVDLVVCHGEFLNTNHEYVHKNKNVKGFGSYGDIIIRDRKMYVVPTPFGLSNGLDGHQTLILPAAIEAGEDFFAVGVLSRKEAKKLIIGYSFDLNTNELIPGDADNPGAEREHTFRAWRLKGSEETPVEMKDTQSKNVRKKRKRAIVKDQDSNTLAIR
jgi:hypothetical protein